MDSDLDVSSHKQKKSLHFIVVSPWNAFFKKDYNDRNSEKNLRVS